MSNATVLLTTFLFVGTCAAANYPELEFACNLKAIKAAERPRYNELVKRIRASIRDRREIANGYAFRLDSDIVTLPDVAEWIAMERLCCPLFTLQLSTAGNQASGAASPSATFTMPAGHFAPDRETTFAVIPSGLATEYSVPQHQMLRDLRNCRL